MKLSFVLFLLTFSCSLIAQQNPVPTPNKGVKKITPSPQSGEGRGEVYAVVVGISDYQDPAIPDLRYADKDAEAFANFLRSEAGGKLDGNQLKVLINQQATMAQFAIQLDWLLEKAKENDRVFIYFSGHGDVEKKTLTQPGFLLCWDAPAQVYMSGGAFALPMLQEVISTLSVQNKAQVVVITDACRSGKLSGSSINGNQLTNANLAKQYANEIKILSCQPNEYSIEGEQWGGGRGAFSYNLVNALYGMADNNKDQIVNLQEVGRYLEDHVTNEVAPLSQVPLIIGNRNERMNNVDENLLAAIRSGKTNQTILLSSIESKGIEDEVLSNLDSTTNKIYKKFLAALVNKQFLSPENSCAESYYSQLINDPKLERLHSTLKRNYAAALQDDAQQTLNDWLKTKVETSKESIVSQRLPSKVFKEKVKLFPRCLDRAAELLGQKHYMYATLQARKYFFEAYILANSNKNPNPELGNNALTLFRQSLQWQPAQPHVYWQMSCVFGWNLQQPDSVEYYAWLSLETHPNWTTACLDASFWFSEVYQQRHRARPFLEQALRIDSTSPHILNRWAIYNFSEKNYEEAERQIKKGLALDSTVPAYWNNLGYLYLEIYRYSDAEVAFKRSIELDSTYANTWINLGWMYNHLDRFSEAERALKKAVLLDSTNVSAWNNLGSLYTQIKRYEEAEKAIKKSAQLDSTSAKPLTNLGFLLISARRFEESEQAFKKAMAVNPNYSFVWMGLGSVYFKTQRFEESETAFKKAINIDSTKIFSWVHLAFAQLYLKKYSVAEVNSKRAIALDTNNALSHYVLGMVYFKTNRPEEATNSFVKSLNLNSKFVNGMLGLAYLQFSEGKTEDAFEYIKKAIESGVSFEQLHNDMELEPWRSQPKWQLLMKKHFPKQFKD